MSTTSQTKTFAIPKPAGFYFVTAVGAVDGLPVIQEYQTEDAARYGIDLLQTMGCKILSLEWEGKTAAGRRIIKNLKWEG